jgi:hypothetical protein
MDPYAVHYEQAVMRISPLGEKLGFSPEIVSEWLGAWFFASTAETSFLPDSAVSA